MSEPRKPRVGPPASDVCARRIAGESYGEIAEALGLEEGYCRVLFHRFKRAYSMDTGIPLGMSRVPGTAVRKAGKKKKPKKSDDPADIVPIQSVKAAVVEARTQIQLDSPRAADILLAQMEQLATMADLDPEAAFGEAWEGLGSNQKVRAMLAKRRESLSASRILYQYLDKILAYSLGYPTQEHKVTHGDEITDTARALAEFGPAFLKELRKTLVLAAKERSEAAQPPGLDPAMEVQPSTVEGGEGESSGAPPLGGADSES